MFHSILLAMSTASNPVKEFAIVPSDGDLWLFVQSFNLMPRQARWAAAVFSNLTKLKLTLIHDNLLSKDEGVFKDMQIAKTLSTANNLEVLFIEAEFENVFDVFGITSFEAVFHGCHFRKLKTLYLFALHAQVQEMLGFLSHIEKLEHFVISCCELKTGLWSDLAEWSRTYGHLKFASFDQLYGGFGDVDLIEWVRCFQSAFSLQSISDNHRLRGFCCLLSCQSCNFWCDEAG